MLRGGGGATSRAYVDLRGELTYIRETGRETERERQRRTGDEGGVYSKKERVNRSLKKFSWMLFIYQELDLVDIVIQRCRWFGGSGALPKPSGRS